VRTAAAVLVAVLAIPVIAADFFIGDTAFVEPRPRTGVGNVIVATDGELFYVFANGAMSRLRPDGTPVDAEAFAIPDLSDPDSVAYGRGIFVVTHRHTGTFTGGSYVTAISAAGQVLWSQYGAPDTASVVFDGRDFIVVARSEDRIVAGILGDDGFATSLMTIAEVSASATVGMPVAVRTDRGLLAVWRENEVMRAVAFDASGPLGQPSTIGSGPRRGLGAPHTGSYAVATNGTEALVVWVNAMPGSDGPLPVRARHVDALGAPAGPAFDIVPGGYAGSPEVLWDGARYRVSWSAQAAVGFNTHVEMTTVAAGVSEAAAVESVTPAGGMILSPAMAVARGTIGLAWSDYMQGGLRGKFASAGDSLATAPEQLLRTEPYDAIAPAALWAGDQYVVAWLRSRGSGVESVVVRRFDRNGTPLDAEPRVAGPASNTGYIGLAATGSELAVVWTDNGRVRVRRLAMDGTPIDEETLVLAGDAARDGADVASDGRRFLIAWADGNGVKAQRLSGRGGPVDEHPLEVTEHNANRVRLAFDGTRYVAAVRANEIRAATITTGGSVSDTVVIPLEADFDLAIATNGSTHLFLSARNYVLTDRDFRNAKTGSSWYLTGPRALWNGSAFVASANGVVAWISPDGTLAQGTVPQAGWGLPENALAVSGDGTVLLVHSARRQSLRVALHARTIAPRRRALR
jgi:hypothetical protein